jgi:hypothetical protein
MNIFYLSHDTTECAQMHVDKHCVKMILEYAQLLSTAHRVLDDVPEDSMFYKMTHVNHPSAVWVRSSFKNYFWLSLLLDRLCKEYTYRYGKTHKVELSGLVFKLANLPVNIPICDFTEPTPAMPEEYKVAGDSIQSYKNYYNGAKRNLFSWKNRAVPTFITGEL